MLIQKVPIGTVAYMGGLPSNLEEFTWSWGQMIQYNNEYLCRPGEFVHLERSRTSFHSSARNYLTRVFLGDWLFMTDMDHQFDPDLVARMVSIFTRFDLNVLVGLYLYKNEPHLPVIYSWSEEKQCFLVIGNWAAPSEDLPIMKIDCAGAGCILIRRRVFDHIRKEMEEDPFSQIGPLSEDFSFFRRCLLLNIPVYCEPRCFAKHLIVKGLEMGDRDLSDVSMVPRDSVK